MRIWDFPPSYLCRQHLLGEHRELHGLWNILTKHSGKGGYSRHPETMRWVGKEHALYLRHEALVEEMLRRNYQHHSPIDIELAIGESAQNEFINTLAEQADIIKLKGCLCGHRAN